MAHTKLNLNWFQKVVINFFINQSGEKLYNVDDAYLLAALFLHTSSIQTLSPLITDGQFSMKKCAQTTVLRLTGPFGLTT